MTIRIYNVYITLMENNGKANSNFKFKLSTLILIWFGVLLVSGVLYAVSFASIPIIKAETFWLLNIALAFATFVVTSFFSYVLIKHTDIINEQNRKNNDSVNARSESFRTLQFVASNYAAVDFVDYMLIYEVYGRYINELKKTLNFQFYMREEGVSLDDIANNFHDFVFVAVRIPIQPLSSENKISSIKFSDFHFHKEDTQHYFVPCSEHARNALILFNKEEKRQEVAINLVVRKSSEFWLHDAVNPFLKITFNHTMFSLLGVSVSGWTELYFVNPQKVEKSGANKYTINSSQFEISGLPKLSERVKQDIIGQV